MRHIIVVDIETIKDSLHTIKVAPFIGGLKGSFSKAKKSELKSGLAGVAGIKKDGTEQEDKYQEALNKTALSPIGGRIACIGVWEILENDGTNKVSEKWHFLCSNHEHEILTKFKALINDKTEFVTFNGRGFDFPFIMFRAAVHGIDLNLPIYPYNGKDGHFDLMLHAFDCSNLSALGIQYPASLKKWAEYFGLGTKLSIKDGEIDIQECFDNDRDMLETYSLNDVDITKKLFYIFKAHFKQRYFREDNTV